MKKVSGFEDGILKIAGVINKALDQEIVRVRRSAVADVERSEAEATSGAKLMIQKSRERLKRRNEKGRVSWRVKARLDALSLK